jgi:Ni,Fe-hydrogenase III small subunit/formate hydrogenlyase subunit 6/NADH:ubiquinone oxidoreductase subunit I
VLKLLSYIAKTGIATTAKPCPPLDAEANGLPALTNSPCAGTECNACATACPTDAIEITDAPAGGKVALDLGACISCQLCIDLCPTATIVSDRSTTVARKSRSDLVLHNTHLPASTKIPPKKFSMTEQLTVLFPGNKSNEKSSNNLLRRSLHARVVSTGCSACDMEIAACGNPVFDLERFGAHIVASPRFADALLVTGPVSKGMRDSLLRCYAAMAEPKIVAAVGTCAISGGVHKNGYTEANGVDKFLPVDVYIPGCPPHPWNIIHGILLAMGKVKS